MEKSVGVTMTEPKLPNLLTPLPGPKAREVIARDAQFVSPSYTRGYPLVAKTGRGAMVEDVDGNRVPGFCRGHRRRLHGALPSARRRSNSKTGRRADPHFRHGFLLPRGWWNLRERLAAVAPGKEAKKVYFGNSGTEAIEAAIKLARYHTRRDKIIAFHGCFHGRTLGALSLTASKAVQRKGFGALLGRRISHSVSEFVSLPVRQSFAVRHASSRRRFWSARFSSGWSIPRKSRRFSSSRFRAKADTSPRRRNFCSSCSASAASTESCWCATKCRAAWDAPENGGPADHAGIEPDILCVAKGIASGMPLSATIARASLMDWKPGAHASTFGGNPVCVAAALATMDLLETQYIENARRVGEFLMGRMADWPARHRIVGDVRGKGLMIGVEIVRDQKTKERAGDFREAIVDRAFEKGLLLLGAGENTIRIAPPLMIDEEQADFAAQTLEACISEIEKSA